MSHQRGFLIAFWIILSVGAAAMFARSTASHHRPHESLDPGSVSADEGRDEGESIVASSRETAAEAQR